MREEDSIQPRPYEATIGDQRITGIYSGSARPLQLVVALHGGGYDATYWHGLDGGPLSLLTLGRLIGFDMLAIDRPGYRGTTTGTPDGLPFDAQADILFDLVDALAPSPEIPVYLIGHSMGGILALVMAAHRRSSRLSAIDVSGVPLRYPAEMQPILDRAFAPGAPHIPDPGDENRRWMFYAEDGTFDPRVLKAVRGSNPVPMAEMRNAYHAPAELPPLMARIAIPVQWTIADQEKSSEGGDNMLEHVQSLLTRCPYLRTGLQVASGHNISLHHVARAYHLRALAFFEEVRAVDGRWNPKSE